MSISIGFLSFLALPGRCILCARRSARRRDLCASCESELPHVGNACIRCAIPLERTGTCGRCLQQPPPQDATRTVFRYTWPLDALIPAFKFNGDHAAGRVLGELFADNLPFGARPDCLLPVPLHATRLRERGFNQSLLLAQAAAAKWRIEVNAELIVRNRETAVQSGMNAHQRRRNVRGAFTLVAKDVPRHAAIVDDVVTTGSTTAEIAALLRRVGVEIIEVWTLARTI